MRIPFSQKTIRLIKKALKEDLGFGDVTTLTFIPKSQTAKASIVAKEEGVVAGGMVAKKVFLLRDPGVRVTLHAQEGSRVRKGKKVLSVSGNTRSILEAERTALNFLGHLSGIATLTASYVDKVRGTRAKILDTRKTTPLWRELEKDAVLSGGGKNHRLGLWDEVLVKDNHWRAMHPLLNETRCRYFGRRLRPLLKRRKFTVETEVRSVKELRHLLKGSYVPDRILLDNFKLPQLKKAVLLVEKRFGARPRKPLIEASGGIHLGNVRKIAETGVDRISVGRLTHSAPALDYSLRLERVSS